MPIRAVAFDVDGTLYPNAAMYLRSLPFALTHLRLFRAYAAVRRQVRTMRPLADLKTTEAELLAGRLGVTAAEASRRIEEEIHGKWEAVLDRVDPYPHVLACLERFKKAGLLLAVSSDFPVERKLSRLGVDGHFECRLWSADSGYLKPHPEPFDEIVACLGVPAAETLYVGNSYSYDVIGAKRAGMLAAHLSRRRRRDSAADFTFNDYRALERWVLERAAPK